MMINKHIHICIASHAQIQKISPEGKNSFARKGRHNFWQLYIIWNKDLNFPLAITTPQIWACIKSSITHNPWVSVTRKLKSNSWPYLQEMVTLHLFLLQPGTLISQLQCIFQIAINRTAVASISVNMAIVARILFNITILVRIAVNKGYVHNSCKLYSTVIVVVAVNTTVKVMVALNIIE